MSKKIPLAVTIALVFFFSALTVILTVSLYLRSYTKTLFRFSEQAKQYSLLTEIEALVQSNFVGEINEKAENVATAKGYIAGLGDANAAYMTPDEYKSYTDDVSGKASGIGVQTQFSTLQNALMVTGVVKNSPADLADIKANDLIVEVNKKSVSVSNYSSLQKMLARDSEEDILLKLNSGVDEEGNVNYKTVSLHTGYRLSAVDRSVNGRTGYIRVFAFYDDTAEQFNAALDSLLSKNVTKLIVDVRNNSSTNYDAAAAVIDRLVPLASDGTRALASARDAENNIIKSYPSDKNAVSVPVAVLINDRTEGAAELLAADLRDFLNAKLIGESTAGNAGYTNTFMLEDGSALIVSVAKIYPYISDCYQDTGIAPDIEIILPDFQKDALDQLSLEEDAQYSAAVSALS